MIVVVDGGDVVIVCLNADIGVYFPNDRNNITM